MEKSSDSMQLNDAAYFASEAKILLPEAEAAGKKAQQQLEQESAKTSLTGLTQKDLTLVNQLSNVWDTVGWIDFQQGNADEAEPFIRASWILRQEPTVGLHLGQVLEQQGKRKDALRVYQLAYASRAQTNRSADVAEIRTHIRALGGKVEDHTPDSINTELQDMRGAKIAHTQPAFGSAEFFIALSPQGVGDVRLLPSDSDKEKIKNVEQLLKTARFNEPFPPGSAARIIRRGVMTCSAGGKECTAVLLFPQSAKAE
jgi:tetratricopeptide (TPR) repeat protein